MRRFYVRAVCSVLVCCISCLCAWGQGKHKPLNTLPAGVSKNESPSQCNCSFERKIIDIFNARKSSVVRVVCVSKIDANQKDDAAVKQILSGTGFFVSDRAHILTTASIVKGSHKIWIDYGGASYAAECVGIDNATNTAVLKLLQSPDNFGIVDLHVDDDNKLTEIGSFVVFVGCKLGMDPLPELGNVTGKNITYSDNEFLTTYLRTNLMFCGGESGAPVFDIHGRLAGMMIASLPEMVSSFVLPRRVVSKVCDDILKHGAVKHNKVGVEIKAEYIFGEGQKIVISKVIPDSSAEIAGLLVGDVICRVEGHVVKYREDFYNSIFFGGQGGSIDIMVIRDGKELSFSVKNEYLSD